MHFVEIYYIPTRGRCGIHQWNNANLWLTVSHVEPRNARIPGLGATRNHPIFWGLRKLISFEIFRILKNTSVKFLPLWTLDFDLVYWCFLNCVCVFFKGKSAVQHNQPPVVLSAMTSSQLWRAWYLMCGCFAVIVTMFGRGRSTVLGWCQKLVKRKHSN